MSFINPLLLIGILAAGIPLFIHLWSRRQAKLVDFSNVQFLISLHRKRIKRLKLKQILILVLRMLIIALIVMALARPILTSRWALAAGGRVNASVVIILDNSYSMSYETFDGSRLDIAKDKAISILKSLQPGDDASLILMSDYPDVVFKKLSSDIQQVVDSIKNARLSHRGSSAWPSIREAYELLKESDHPRKVIYLISDLGENSWQNWKEMPDSDKADVFAIRVGEPDADNRAIESVLISSEPVGIGMPARVSAKLMSSGSDNAGTVEMLVDGEKRGQSASDIQTPVSFAHTFEHPGTHVGEIRLTPDRLPVDDVRYFAVDVLGQIKTLTAGDYKFYVNLALNPAASLNPEEEYLILPISSTIEELGRLSLNQYDVIALVDVPRLPESAVRNLESFVLNGGNIVIFLGEAANRDWYNGFKLMPATLGDRMLFSKSPLKLSKWNTDHPIFKIFLEPEAGRNTVNALDSLEFYSAFALKPHSTVKVIASFDKGIPAVLEAQAGQGRIILFNSSPDTRVSDLPLKPGFLPLVQQTIFYLVSSGEAGSGRNILVGDTYIQYIKESVDSPPQLFDLENNSVTLAVSASERGNQIQYGPVEQAGIYKLEYRSGGNLRRSYFAANLNTAGESELIAAKDSDVLDKLGERARFVSLDESPEEMVRSTRGESELSSRLLIAAAILMLIEIPLANRRRI